MFFQNKIKFAPLLNVF